MCIRDRYIYSKIKRLIEIEGLNIAEGQKVDVSEFKKLASAMSKHLAMSLNLIEKDSFHKSLYTNEGNPISAEIELDGVTSVCLLYTSRCV